MKTVGIIGAMECEISMICASLKNSVTEKQGGITFFVGDIGSMHAVVAKCGEGKVNAAVCAATMIAAYRPDMVVNTGCMGGLAPDLKVLDVVVATVLTEHDLDYGVLGIPRGTVFLPDGRSTVAMYTDEGVAGLLLTAARNSGVNVRPGPIASGDLFVCTESDRQRIRETFGADGCEMEGAAIAHACLIAGVPFGVIRSVSDGANDGSGMTFAEFSGKAAAVSASIVVELSKLF